MAPKDGWAYDATELNAIWGIPVAIGDLADGRLRRLLFERHVGNTVIADRIAQASIGDCDALIYPDHENTQRVGEIAPPVIEEVDDHTEDMFQDGWIHEADLPPEWLETEDRPANRTEE